MARWIAFEGGEASGKSTQAGLLAARLPDAVLTREPGGTVVGERVRSLLLDPSVAGLDHRAEALLMAADRAQHVAEVVRPALSDGRSVVSDRSAYSSLAYQGYGRGLGVEAVFALCDWATSGLWPDLAILLDVSSSERSSRVAGVAPDRLESAGDDFHALVDSGFAALVAAEPSRWLVVDGSGPVDEVAARVNDAFDAWVLAADG
ncbi:MAG: dTMP kinase [Actinomycetota bacterium]|nr:dTMP kinase [Actinomycetota bacterium]